MAFNFPVFKTRALSAVVFAVIMLTGLLVNLWTFLLLFTVIHFGCWREYQKLVALIHPAYSLTSAFHRFGIMLLGYGFVLFMTNNAYRIGSVPVHEAGKWLMVVMAVLLAVNEVLHWRRFQEKSTGYSLLGLLYISLSWGLLIDLRNNGMEFSGTLLSFDTGRVIPIVLIASIWINDTMAYLVGSFIGRTPFSKISPKKTWEGTIAGAILAVAAVTLTGYYGFGLNWKQVWAIAAIAAVAGTAGDLLESKLKRMAGVKDSGNMMPGHGGFLDRFDSLVFATPFVWLYITCFT